MPKSTRMPDEWYKRLNAISDWIKNDYPSKQLKTYDDFMHVSVNVANHIRLLLLTASSLTGDSEVNREDGFDNQDAVILGLMVRIKKLFEAMIEHVLKREGDIAQIFPRLIWESSINILLFIKKPVLINTFIRNSFKTNKEIYEDLTKVKEKQGGLDEYGEYLLQRNIQVVEKYGYSMTELLELRGSDWKLEGKSIRDLSKELFPEYYYTYIFTNLSSAIHGDWRDLSQNHLQEDNGKYLPNHDHFPVSPNYILPVSFIVIEAVRAYLEWIVPSDQGFFKEMIEKLKETIKDIDQKYVLIKKLD